MEEADVLADRIAILAAGRLAALGSAMDLKARFGVGYTLTLARARLSAPSSACAAPPETLCVDGASSLAFTCDAATVATQSPVPCMYWGAHNSIAHVASPLHGGKRTALASSERMPRLRFCRG